MDSYLILAEQVLREARRPLTAKQILSQAYLSAIVPAQLFGKTQHKTLGARLSEDILHRRERSAFFRTQPGQFFLRAFLNDAGVPARYRSEITARRRQRELLHGRALAISKSDVQFSPDSFEPPQSITDILSSHNYRYLRTMSRRPPDVFVLWSFVIVARHDQVLTYRHGRYREDRDSFFKRRSVGFFSPVVDRDRDLFALEDHGIVVNGLRAITMDLDLPRAGVSPDEYASRMKLEGFLVPHDGAKANDLLAIVRFNCPSWFEPLTRRLAINDLAWMSVSTPVNDIGDFDPWSQVVVQWLQKAPVAR